RVEAPADHRCVREDGALARAETLETRGQQRLDRRWQRSVDERALLGDEGEQLLDEERVAFGARGDAVEDIAAERLPAEQVVQERRRFAPRKDLKLELRGFGEEAVVLVEQFLARQSDDEDRPDRPRNELCDQVEQRRLRPLQIVEDEDQR